MCLSPFRRHVAIALVLLAFTSAASAQGTSLPGMWYDQDKTLGYPVWYYADTNNNLRWDQGEPTSATFEGPYTMDMEGDRWHKCWINDTDGNGAYTLGETFSKYLVPVPPTWSNGLERLDTSCWMATAANMLRYIGGPDRYLIWGYYAGVNVGGTIKTFDYGMGGTAAEALASDGFTSLDVSFPSANWISGRLQMGLPVGIGVLIPFGSNHTLTVYSIDTTAKKITIADSDRDAYGANYSTYSYDAYGPQNILVLTDYSGGPGAEIARGWTFATCDWCGSGTGSNSDSSGLRTWWGEPSNWANQRVPNWKEVANLQFSHTGTVNITSGVAASTTYLLVDGSAMVVLLPGASLNVSGNENIGVQTWGWFTQSGGTHSISSRLQLGCRAGTSANFTLSGGDLSADTEYIGLQGTGIFSQSGGSNTVLNDLVLGRDPGSDGTYELYSQGTVSCANLYVGMSGTGTVKIQNGGQVSSTNGILGYDGDSNGTVTVDGTGSKWTNSQNLYVGYSGTGTLKIQNGGQVHTGSTTIVTGKFIQEGGRHVTDALNVGEVNGVYELSGGNLEVGGMTWVGVPYSGTGTFIHTAGKHTVDFLKIGECGCTGTYELRGSGQIVANSIWIGDTATGSSSLIQEGGENTVNTELCVGGNSDTEGTYTLSGGTLTTARTYIGKGGTGNMVQTGGSNVPSGTLFLGYDSGATGTYRLSGGTLIAAQHEIVGCSGTGSFVQTGGTNTVNAGYWLDIGYLAGSQGSYLLESGSLSAGNESIGYQGSGQFTQTGGTHTVSETIYLGYYAGGEGIYNLDAGQLTTPNLKIGIEGTGTLNIQNGGALTASQVVLKGTDSALNLGDGTGISTATTKVDLNDASARLNFNSGQLAASEGGALVYGAGQVNLNGPAYISTTFTNSSIGNVIAGSGGLTKTGAGTLILTNTNAYTGTTTVSAGTLQAKKAAALPNYSTTGTISVAYGATLAVNAGAGSPTEWSDTEIQGLLANANVTFATGASFGIDTTGGDFAYGFDITKNNCDMCLTKLGSNTLTLTGTGTWTSSTTVSAGTLKIQNGGRIGDFDGCVGDNSSSNATVTVDGMGSIWGNYYSLTVGLHGTGTLNIQNGGQVGCFWGSLGDYSGSSGTVTVDGSGSIWNNGGTLYVGGWGDDPGGTGSLTVKNGGQVTVGDTLKMLKADSEVTVSGATLTAGALEGSTGTIRITDPVEGTALTVGSGTFSGIILDDTGPGSLTKVGVGTLALTGASTYSGGTTLSAGTLFVNNTSGSGTGSGTVTVNSTGTLGGTGTIGGATTISGHHAPGSSAGIQTFLSDLTYNASSDVTWELVANTPTQGPPAVFDQIVVGGDLDFAGATDLALVFNATGSAVDWFDAFWNTPQSWLVYDVAGMTSNFANLSLTVDNWADSTGALFNTALPSGSFSLSQSGQDVMLNYAPEPATLALLALGGVAALARRRRR